MLPLIEGEGYRPSRSIISRSLLTAPQLIDLFEDFKDNLRHISTSPDLVFEILLANLHEKLNPTIELNIQQQQDVAPQETKRLMETELSELRIALQQRDVALQKSQASIKQLESELTELRGRIISEEKNPTLGTFSTLEQRRYPDIWEETSKVVTFYNPYKTLPGLPIGLNMLDVGDHANPSIKAYPSSIRNNSFEINIDSWSGLVLIGGSCGWLEIAPNDPDFQFGSYSTLEDHPKDQALRHKTRNITFPRPYAEPPQVVVWIAGFNTSIKQNCRIRTFVTEITRTGFTIHIATWEDTILYFGMATWVAYTSTKCGIASGHFSTMGNSLVGQHQEKSTGFVQFGVGVFKHPPRVIVALNSFDLNCKRVMRLAVKASSITAAGMFLDLETWNDSIVSSASASYIALV